MDHCYACGTTTNVERRDRMALLDTLNLSITYTASPEDVYYPLYCPSCWEQDKEHWIEIRRELSAGSDGER